MRSINRNSFWFRAIKLVHKKSYPLNEFSLTFWLTPVLLRLAAVHYRDYDWNYLRTDDGQMWRNLSKKALVCIWRVTIDFKQNLKKWKLKIYDFKELQTWQSHCQINNVSASRFHFFTGKQHVCRARSPNWTNISVFLKFFSLTSILSNPNTSWIACQRSLHSLTLAQYCWNHSMPNNHHFLDKCLMMHCAYTCSKLRERAKQLQFWELKKCLHHF